MKYLLSILFFAVALWGEPIEVTIIYGNEKPDKVITTDYPKGITALELLKSVSRVETAQKGKFTFVRSVDGVQSVVGKFGWFYLIDGQSVHKMAQNYVLEDAKTMTWVYKVEACY
ncbi:DUF4430 domain-containing protein [Sulfuricurvum sp.]|uniref:DUF4430 domain-containing protein n=1 Tax=Sulfuricurvum sp. TaxID=2025608 RepID=UPI003BB4A48E